jgi:hypothetical protein
VSDPLDVVKELASTSDMIVLGVNNLFNEILRAAVHDDRQWRGLLLIDEGIGVFGFQLQYMKDGVDLNSSR